MAREKTVDPKRRAELDAHALAYVNGRLFGSWMFHDAQEAERMIPMVFMPLVFLKRRDALDLKRRGVVHFYELMERAGPRSVNGYPMFMSMHTLTREEAAYLHDRATAIKAAQDAALATPLPPRKPPKRASR